MSDLKAWNEILADENAALKARIRELEDELKVMRRAIGPEPSRWVDSDGSYGEDTNLAAKYDGTLADAMAEAHREIDPVAVLGLDRFEEIQP